MSLFEQPDGSGLRGQLLGNLEGMQEWEHFCLFVYMSVGVYSDVIVSEIEQQGADSLCLHYS